MYDISDRFYLFLFMTTVASVEDSQFDDAPEDVGYARIDDAELIDLTSDEVRVEDEDWEVAEKGMGLHVS